MNNSQSKSGPIRVFAVVESIGRLLIPIGVFASLFVPVAVSLPREASATLGACIAGFTIIRIVRRINRRDDPRCAGRPA